jgi:hypothetical protein
MAVDEDYAPMATSCGVGECAANGQTTCVDGSEGDTCTPGTPTAEVCDGLDNDCDGPVDEDFNLGMTCTVGIGECENQGAYVCTADGSGTECDAIPGTPAADDSTCDGLDNDCDGGIDEDFAPQATTCGVGACAATGTTTCVDGSTGDTCTPGTPGDEGPPEDPTCSDGVDNDCDGLTDLIDPDPDCEVELLDLDIVKFRVSNSVKLGDVIKRMQLTLRNTNGPSQKGAFATLVGMQNGVEVYNKDRFVFDISRNGRARFAFLPFEPTVTGTINWTLTIADTDTDLDIVTSSTNVK